MTAVQGRVLGRVLGQVLITGASSGIGKASAQAFAQAGFNVVLVARSQAKLTALTSELAALGVEAQSFAVDLADEAQVKEKMAQVIAAVGPIDIVVNNAGMGYTGRLGTMPLADWQRVMALNVTAAFQVVQAVLPGMRSRTNGLIINIASIAAQQSFENWGAYGVSKAALVALSGAIAAEESAQGIRVVTLSLGAVNTPLWQSDTVQSDFDSATMLHPDTVAQTILHIALLPPSAVMAHLTLTPAQGAL